MEKDIMETTHIDNVSKQLSHIITAVEQIRSGKFSPENLKTVLEQMKETLSKLPVISDDLKTIKSPTGDSAAQIMEDGFKVYQKVYGILNLFLTDKKTELLEEGMEAAREAQDKLSKISNLISDYKK